MFALVGGVAAIIIIVLLTILVFEVYMFIDAATNKNISSETRVLWLIGMLFLHPIIAIVYYFTDYKKSVH